MRSTQKRADSFINGDLSCRIMPYLGSLLFIEVFYLVMKLSYLYGFATGIAVGVLLFIVLFSLVVSSALGYLIPLLFLIIICEMHAAMSFSSVLLSFFPDYRMEPAVMFVYRAVLFPCEAVIAFCAVRQLRRRDSE
jgi:hypothetical protein